MTTDLIEVWSLEEGDQIVIKGSIYKIVDIDDSEDNYSLLCVDENGYAHNVAADGSKKVRLLIDTALVSE